MDAIVISGSQVAAAGEDGTFHVGGNVWDRCGGEYGVLSRYGIALQRQHAGDENGRGTVLSSSLESAASAPEAS